jgi:acetylornithine deacetylase
MGDHPTPQSIRPATGLIDPIALTRQLCEIESTTYNEGAVGDYLAELLSSYGWQVEKTPVPQPRDGMEGERWNVYASIQGQRADLVFSTHMDTVPPYIPFREDDEFVYGRGVCDAKGIMAAQIAAATLLREAGYNVGMLFVSGEERDSAGAKVANANPRGSKFLINGEPTDNRVALASKGALRVSLKTSGKMAHSAYPELGDSAVHKMVVLLDRLLKTDWPVDPDAGDTTLNIGQISGGYAPNVIADKAEAQVLIRLVTDSAPVREKILAAAEGLAEVTFTLDLAFVRLKAVEGLPTMVAKFATDIPELTNWGAPVLLGPGSIHTAHTPDEQISKKELVEAVSLYVEVAKQLLK